jgi:predicted phosphoadenosine phosphosulfate sulfurtransferase
MFLVLFEKRGGFHNLRVDKPSVFSKNKSSTERRTQKIIFNNQPLFDWRVLVQLEDPSLSTHREFLYDALYDSLYRSLG